MTTAFDKFYDSPSPANAIELAIADHRAQTGGGSREFVEQLQAALEIVKSHDKVRDALTECITQEWAYCFKADSKKPLINRLNNITWLAREALK